MSDHAKQHRRHQRERDAKRRESAKFRASQSKDRTKKNDKHKVHRVHRAGSVGAAGKKSWNRVSRRRNHVQAEIDVEMFAAHAHAHPSTKNDPTAHPNERVFTGEEGIFVRPKPVVGVRASPGKQQQQQQQQQQQYKSGQQTGSATQRSRSRSASPVVVAAAAAAGETTLVEAYLRILGSGDAEGVPNAACVVLSGATDCDVCQRGLQVLRGTTRYRTGYRKGGALLLSCSVKVSRGGSSSAPPALVGNQGGDQGVPARSVATCETVNVLLNCGASIRESLLEAPAKLRPLSISKVLTFCEADTFRARATFESAASVGRALDLESMGREKMTHVVTSFQELGECDVMVGTNESGLRVRPLLCGGRADDLSNSTLSRPTICNGVLLRGCVVDIGCGLETDNIKRFDSGDSTAGVLSSADENIYAQPADWQSIPFGRVAYVRPSPHFLHSPAAEGLLEAAAQKLLLEDSMAELNYGGGSCSSSAAATPSPRQVTSVATPSPSSRPSSLRATPLSGLSNSDSEFVARRDAADGEYDMEDFSAAKSFFADSTLLVDLSDLGTRSVSPPEAVNVVLKLVKTVGGIAGLDPGLGVRCCVIVGVPHGCNVADCESLVRNAGMHHLHFAADGEEYGLLD